MYSNRVNVLHATDSYGVSVGVAHCLKLDLLPAENILLNEDLRDRRCIKSVLCYNLKLANIICNTAACSTECECGTNDHGESYSLCYIKRASDIVCYVRGNAGLTDLFHCILEKLSVLCLVYSLCICAEKSYVVLLQETLVRKLHSKGKSCLSAKTCKEAVGLFLFDDSLDSVNCKRLKVYLVCKRVIGHNGSGVGVYENYVYSCFLEHVARLRARIVKLCRLTDDDGA